MPGYTCTKCGSTGYSKNIATRNFFPDNQRAALLSNIIKIDTITKVNGKRQVAFTIPYGDGPKTEGMPDDTFEIFVLKEFRSAIEKLDDKTLTDWICNHNYTTEGEPDC